MSDPVEQPSLPFLALGGDGSVLICHTSAQLGRASLSALVHGYFPNLIAYDSASRWSIIEVIAPYRVSFWTRFLAATVFNPCFAVTLRWQRNGNYPLSELCDRLCIAIDQDDDVLTQFVGADELKRTIRASETYEEIVSALEYHH